MKIQKYFFVFIIAVISLCSYNVVYCQSLDELLKKGDNYLDVDFNNQKALEIFQNADNKFPNNWEVFWRLSRTNVYIAEKMPDNTSGLKDAQLAVYQLAYDYANKSVKLAPDKSITYLRRAVANGRIALFKGVFSVAGVVNAVKADCEKAISLGNGGNYTQGLAHYVLARTNDQVSEKWAPARAVIGLGWANMDNAIKEYETAVKLYPNFRMFYLDFAKAYIKEDEYIKAKEMLKKVLESPKREENDDEALAEAKNLSEKIRNK
jgi:tetratricopeptide (TPR) repeat protein